MQQDKYVNKACVHVLSKMCGSIRIDCCYAIADFFSGKTGAVWINTAPALILIIKYENIKLKKRIPSG
jgi:hypothetical protein